ncbi:acetyltransferase [Aeromonas cavernicola]|uniref:Acetyltransferase n=1 Tax=Aeromonas cavernicola TaxID=1006623 RepID=A0A2H9U836_9GAMM|nr:acetyltransferase [Aeromonas cavernicola]PJG60162.1 acetyltransferase [Aeromonas cavernicola]
MTKCAILGASGHGKVIADMAELNGYTEVHFFDDRWPQLNSIAHWSVKGDTPHLLDSVSTYDLVTVAIGHNTIRLNKLELLKNAGAKLMPLIHPSASVSRYANLGQGSVVMANAVINAFVSIGIGAIINTCASVDHDCELADGVHISPNASLAGSVHVGRLSWIGIGAQIKQLTRIGHEVVIGAGATVIRDVPDFEVVVGTPASTISRK